MKKTFSMLLAVIMAALAVCTFSVIGFADVENDDPSDAFVTAAPTEAATEAPTVAPTAAPTTEAATEAPTESATEATTNLINDLIGLLTTKSAEEISKENEDEPIVTNPEGVTAIVGDETTAAPAAPATTKKPANVDTTIPGTGSSIVPAIALLALAAGTVAVVKAKKED